MGGKWQGSDGMEDLGGFFQKMEWKREEDEEYMERVYGRGGGK